MVIADKIKNERDGGLCWDCHPTNGMNGSGNAICDMRQGGGGAALTGVIGKHQI